MIAFHRSGITTGLELNKKKKGGGGGKGGIVCPRKSTQIPENQVHCPRFFRKIMACMV